LVLPGEHEGGKEVRKVPVPDRIARVPKVVVVIEEVKDPPI
jgi:hypothetical protein